MHAKAPIRNAETIKRLTELLIEAAKPKRIIMFGSYAFGTPAEYSDLDLLVIMRYVGSGLRKAVEILNRVKPRIPVDLVVRTPEEIQERMKANDFFLAEIFSRERVLYEAPYQ